MTTSKNQLWVAYKVVNDKLMVKTPDGAKRSIDYKEYFGAYDFAINSIGTKIVSNASIVKEKIGYLPSGNIAFENDKLIVFDFESHKTTQILPCKYFSKSPLDSVVWVPGQDRIIFSKSWTGMFSVRSDGSGLEAILRGSNIDNFSTSPSGRYIAFIKYKSGTGDHLGVFDVAKNTAKVYKNTASSWCWLDNHRIVFYKYDNRLRVLDVRTGQTSTLLNQSRIRSLFQITLSNETGHFGLGSCNSEIVVAENRIYFCFYTVQKRKLLANSKQRHDCYFVSVTVDGSDPIVHVGPVGDAKLSHSILPFKSGSIFESFDHIAYKGNGHFIVRIAQENMNNKLIGFRFEKVGQRPEGIDETWSLLSAQNHCKSEFFYLTRSEMERQQAELDKRIRNKK